MTHVKSSRNLTVVRYLNMSVKNELCFVDRNFLREDVRDAISQINGTVGTDI